MKVQLFVFKWVKVGIFFCTFMQKVIVYGNGDKIQLLKEGAREAVCYDHSAHSEFPASECSEVLHIGI